MERLLNTLVVLSTLLAILVVGQYVWGQDVVIHQTIPGTTVRDYSRPSMVIEPDGTGYQTIPGTTVRDYNKPGIQIEGGGNERTIRNQYRVDQPLQQVLPYVWAPQD